MTIIKNQYLPLRTFKELTTISEGNSKNVHILLNFILVFYFTIIAFGHIFQYDFKFTESLKPIFLGKKILFPMPLSQFWYFYLFYIQIVQNSIHAYCPKQFSQDTRRKQRTTGCKRKRKKQTQNKENFQEKKRWRESQTYSYTHLCTCVYAHIIIIFKANFRLK